MSPGVVYLLHFETPYGPRRVQHYLGWTVDLEARVEEHRRGRKSRLMAAIKAHGIDFHVARTWDGGPELERRLKRQSRGGRFFCPLCNGPKAYNRGYSGSRSWGEV